MREYGGAWTGALACRMAPRLPKRPLQPSDLQSPDKLLYVLNPVLEALALALNAGLTLENVKHVAVSMLVTPPDEWIPLTLLNGATPYSNPAFGAPAVRWTPSGTEYRGLLNRPAAGASTTPFARIPDGYTGLAPNVTTPFDCLVTPYAHGALEISPSGALVLQAPSTFPAGGWISLHGLHHAPTIPSPPLWAKPTEARLVGEAGLDYGVPLFVVCTGATRKDRQLVTPDLVPVWDAPIVGTSRNQERRLQIKRLGGLQAGVEHTVNFLCFYA